MSTEWAELLEMELKAKLSALSLEESMAVGTALLKSMISPMRSFKVAHPKGHMARIATIGDPGLRSAASLVSGPTQKAMQKCMAKKPVVHIALTVVGQNQRTHAR